MDTDFLDRRGRLVRMALAIAVGILVTSLVYGWMGSVTTQEVNPDPMSQMGVVLVVLAVFIASTMITLAIMAAVRRRLT
ncbi:MAG TPA: hypothetical protein VIU61_30730 [Kofleriaceae bacterium]